MRNMILIQKNGQDNTEELERKTFLLENLKKVEQTCWESIHIIVCEKDFRQLEGHVQILKQLSRQISLLEKNLKWLSDNNIKI